MLGSTSAEEPLPRPSTESGDLEHGIETEVPAPTYEHLADNMPGTRVSSRSPTPSEPPPVEFGGSRTNAPSELKGTPSELKGYPSAVLVEDDDFNDGGAKWRVATLTKGFATEEGKTPRFVHSGVQSTQEVAATFGTTTQAGDTARRGTLMNLLPGIGRPTRRSSADGVDVVDAVVEAAHCLASHSAIPGVSEAARLVSILVNLVTDYRDCTSEVQWRVKRCRSIIFMLERAGEVLGKVRRRLYNTLGPTSCLYRLVRQLPI